MKFLSGREIPIALCHCEEQSELRQYKKPLLSLEM